MAANLGTSRKIPHQYPPCHMAVSPGSLYIVFFVFLGGFVDFSFCCWWGKCVCSLLSEILYFFGGGLCMIVFSRFWGLFALMAFDHWPLLLGCLCCC